MAAVCRPPLIQRLDSDIDIVPHVLLRRSMSRVLRYEDYTIVWIAILPIEVEAALGALDDRHHGHFESLRGDDYTYIAGEINGHNVVIAKLPAGQNYGVGAAAALANQVKTRFENIWFALLVGVAAGLPNLSATDAARRRDIRLGDVLVCVPDESSTGIIHYDLGRDSENGFEINGRSAEPPALVRSAVGDIQLSKRPFAAGNKLASMLEEFHTSETEGRFDYPGQDQDTLCKYQIDDGSLLSDEVVQRKRRDESERTRVWYGRIGSGSTLMRNAQRRDELRDRYNLIGLEMEAAGVMNALPTGVVRGVCDYGDGHKTKRWQPYAAAVAAVYAKAILLGIRQKPLLRADEHTTRPFYGRNSQQAISVGNAFRLGLHLSEAPVIEDDLFIGRLNELNDMKKAIDPQTLPQRHRRLVLGGIGGIGKTQLAIAFAKRYFHLYDSVFWLDAASEIVLKQSVRRMAQQILDPTKYQESDDDQLLFCFIRWLSDIGNTRWMLIFDNYDEPDAYNIGKYCPFVAHGSAIITTRLPEQVQGQQLLLRPLADIEQSLKVLETRSKRANVRTDSYARDIAQCMQGLPLALATAGAFLHKSTWTFEQYLQDYEERWNLHPRRPLQLREYQDRTLYTTWDMSYRRLEKEDTYAAQLLRLLAYFDNQQIWFGLLRDGMADDSPRWLVALMNDPAGFQDTMRVLEEYGFVEIHLTTQSYSMHACVHHWTLFSLNAKVDPHNYWYAFSCVANSVVDVDWYALATQKYTKLASHANRLLHKRFEETRKRIPPHRLPQASFIALLLGQQRYKTAVAMQELVLSEWRKIAGPEHVSTINAVEHLSHLLAKQDKLVEAEQMLEQVLVERQRLLGLEHSSILTTIDNLGILYCRQGKFVDAEQMYQRALLGREKVFGAGHIETLVTVNNFGFLYHSQGKLEDSERMYTRALIGREKALGMEHQLALDTACDLGMVYIDQGKLAEAEELFRRIILAHSDNQSSTRSRIAIYSLAVIFSKAVRVHASGSIARQTSLAFLFQHTELWAAGGERTINRLANVLICVREDEDAAIACFHSLIYSDGIADFHYVRCDGCDMDSTIAGGRFTCRQCEDLDLCNDCMAKYAIGELSLPTCSGHEFYDVTAVLEKMLEGGEFQDMPDRNVWLAQLRDKHSV